jgi:hypothetical protein
MYIYILWYYIYEIFMKYPAPHEMKSPVRYELGMDTFKDHLNLEMD